VSRYTAPASISTNAFLAASHAASKAAYQISTGISTGVIEAAAIGPYRQAFLTTIAAALVPLASFKAAAAAASASKATAASSAAEEEETAEGLQPRLGRPALDAF
ncbi:hypothetical protein L249_6684, partial [Ophiocordyceps polyrhachis-furcata BCC 54312]